MKARLHAEQDRVSAELPTLGFDGLRSELRLQAGQTVRTAFPSEGVRGAARAYDRQAVEYFGEFARLNFPEEWPPERRAQVHAEREAGDREAQSGPAG